MRITRGQFGKRKRQLPAWGSAGQPVSVRMGGWQQQKELTLGRAEQPSRQADDAADELTQADQWLAGGLELAAEPPVEQVGGQRGVQQERAQPPEGARPQAFQLECSGGFREPAFDGLTRLVERLQLSHRELLGWQVGRSEEHTSE